MAGQVNVAKQPVVVGTVNHVFSNSDWTDRASANIGGSSEYHIDTKFGKSLPWEGIRDRFDALAGKYKEDGRNIDSLMRVSQTLYMI